MTGLDTARKIAIIAGNAPWCDIFIMFILQKVYLVLECSLIFDQLRLLLSTVLRSINWQMYFEFSSTPVPTKYGLDLYLALLVRRQYF